MAKAQLDAHCSLHPEDEKWIEERRENNNDLMAPLAALPKSDMRRLVALDPNPLRQVVHSRQRIHLKVSANVKTPLDIALVQRSSASSLPVSSGDPIPLKPLFKKIIRRTAIVERTPEEDDEGEHQGDYAELEGCEGEGNIVRLDHVLHRVWEKLHRS